MGYATFWVMFSQNSSGHPAGLQFGRHCCYELDIEGVSVSFHLGGTFFISFSAIFFLAVDFLQYLAKIFLAVDSFTEDPCQQRSQV
jgi:hypothetical protein